MRHTLLGTLCVALLPACATNPATGERQLMLVSEGREISMGQQADPEVTVQYGLYSDTALQAYVRILGERLAAVSERPNLPWTFRVVDDPIINAFALPGGFIYVTRGILAHFNSEAELVAVLGHEIGHVTARHSASQMSQQQLAQVGLVAGMVVAPQLQDFAGLAEASLGLLFLKFSRDDERQADDLGLRYLTRSGYDAREMPKVFAMLASVSEGEGGGRLPGWLSTHPDPVDRQQRIARAIAALPPAPGERIVNRNEYLRRLDGMMFGANPREGFFRDRMFLHPDLRFRFEFPAGWRTQNQRRAVVGQSQNQDALIELTLANAGTPESAVQAFVGQPGITSVAFPERFQTRRGMPAARAGFTATSGQARLAGVVWAVRYNQQIFQIMGVSTEARWPGYAALAEQTFDSFAPLTDSTALAVQPLRLDIVTLERAMTLQEFSQRYPSRVSLDVLARLNQVTPAERLEAGRMVKRVVGGPLP
ncbi:MAG TPA: M48 family metalloprotease [Gemmatimonadales bacterium]|nr:M48 family metalloprotease [Gemmatimonadales bacterium]